MAPWKLPLVVAALAVPLVAGFLVGGPAIGVALGALAVVTLLVVAARQRPRGPIGAPHAGDARRYVLIVVTCPVEKPAAVAAIAREAGIDGADGEADVLVLAPASIGFLDRWASDVEGSRRRAQETLVVTVAALAKAGIAAEARVGDEDVLQAVEDQLQAYPADEVLLVSSGAEDAERSASAAAELKARLRAEFRHLVLGGD
ncbi:MAG TPA: hypothetical protein VNM89_00165 [Solirubrobacterales bacterium]|nr:hypothetical protein [Solirubrobacterales bacterium]